MTCFVFPGQGSQFIGMAKDFHDNFNTAKLIFEEIEDTKAQKQKYPNSWYDKEHSIYDPKWYQNSF